MKTKKYDFIVIGSGPGGGPLAWKLASGGLRVLLLEAGPRYDPYKDYNLNKDDWELSKFPSKKSFDYDYGERQPLNKEYDELRSWNIRRGRFNKSGKRKYSRYSQVLGVGGTTLHYQGEAHRMHPLSFNTKKLFGYGNDWPINYDDLDGYYSEVEKIIGVAGPSPLPGRRMGISYPLPPHKFSYTSQVVNKSCGKLGFNLVPNSVAILSEPYRGNVPCNYCNGCIWGCPLKDKGSVDVTFIPLAEATGNCEIRTGAFVSRIETSMKSGDKEATGVVYFDNNGKEHFVGAKNIAVACGAVQTPRLLLNSEINSNNLVGKNFMESVFYTIFAFHRDRLDSYKGIPIDSSIWEWSEPKKGTGAFRIFTFNEIAKGPVQYALNFHRGWGEEFEKDMEEWFGHAFGLAGFGEFLPNENTFVTLSDTKKDPFGNPVAKIQSFLGTEELETMDSIRKRCLDIMDTADIEKYVEVFSTYDFFSATHVYGTCRMGKSPEDSVVDPDLRTHEIPNLYITDASVFPSSGGGESPSLTIEALSLRCADRFISREKS